MFTTRNPTIGLNPNFSNYNENYFTTRKKILNDFMKDEEKENLKYIEETESLVSQTKMFLKDLLSGQVDFDILNDQLEDIQTELENDCNVMKGEISTLKALDENIEKQITNLQKEEENGTKEYMNKIDSLKNELESKEFTIQNMERLYIELEDVIKDNIQKGNEQLLTMEQFSDFLNQNVRLKEEIKLLEQEKIQLDEKYSQILKENVTLRRNDEEYDKKKIDEILKDFEIKEKNKTGKEEALKKINEYKKKQQKLNEEYNNIKIKIEKLIRALKGLNIENNNFNLHLDNIKNELISNELESLQNNKRNKSISYKKLKVIKDNKEDNNNLIRNQIAVFCPNIIKKYTGFKKKRTAGQSVKIRASNKSHSHIFFLSVYFYSLYFTR